MKLFHRFFISASEQAWVFQKQFWIFDYDQTIASVPVNWPSKRSEACSYFNKLIGTPVLHSGMRIDEMECEALRTYHLERTVVYKFRNALESSVQGRHVPNEPVISLIKENVCRSRIPMFVLSNNLQATVESGLSQLGLKDSFNAIFGVDRVGGSKPDISGLAFLQDAGVDVNAAVFFGDSPDTDGAFCLAAGIPFINVNKPIP